MESKATKIRLFIAVPIPRDLRNNIARYQSELKQFGGHVKWVDPENIHLTIKFLGDTPPELIPDIKDRIVAAVNKVDPFEISIEGVGAFPNFKRPRVFWVGAKDRENRLQLLANKIAEGMEALGFEREKRSFSAHLTLGRVKDSRTVHAIINELKERSQFSIGHFSADCIQLIKSQLTRSGPIYTVLEKIELTG